MIDGCRVLALIPARGGSKGVPRKNVRDLGGRPLIAWTVAAARAARTVDRVVVSSDDGEIIAAACAAGGEAPFVRPAALAQDHSTSVEVALHALDALGGQWDYLVLLQPTSPFRTAADIDACVTQCHRSGAAAAVTVTEPRDCPYHGLVVGEGGRLQALFPAEISRRRQDLPATVRLNGAVFVIRPSALRDARTFLADGAVACPMPPERSLDIDTEFDFEVADRLARRLA